MRKIRTDYEAPLRNAAVSVFRKVRLVGCAIHFQRAVAHWGYINGVYGKNRTEQNITAIQRATPLCYFPKEFFEAVVAVIEIGVGNTPFGNKLIDYLRSYWGLQDISVCGELTRSINGSETFHWQIGRVHDKTHNNINQFIRQLQNIEYRCALSIKQFHNCIQSRKQQMIEKMHADIENIFD